MAAVMFRTSAPTAAPVVRDGGRLVVQTWLFTRLLLVGVALWVGVTTGRSANDMLANWDVQHYFAIAANGYTGANDIAFFPGWPLALRALSLVGIPMLWAGVGLAVICSALAAAALHRLGGPIAAVVWLLAPTTVFTLVPYTEAPFCAAAFWAWERAKRGHWGAAASLAAIACTLRVSGLFLLGALVILALTDGRRRPAGPPEQARRSGWTLPWLGRSSSASSGRPAASATGSSSAGVAPGWSGAAAGWPSPSGWSSPPSGPPSQPSRWSSLSRPFSRGSRPAAQPVAAPPTPTVTRRDRVRALAWLAIPALTLFAYMAFLYNLTGDWNAWYRAQSTGWPRGFTWPWVSLQHTLEAAASNAYPAFPEWSWVFRAEIVSMASGVLVTIACLVRRRWAEASWVGVQVLAFSCSYWFLSVNRAVLLWFPLFILIGELLSGGWNTTPGRRRFRILLTVLGFIVAGIVLCFWAWLFFTGRWAS